MINFSSRGTFLNLKRFSSNFNPVKNTATLKPSFMKFIENESKTTQFILPADLLSKMGDFLHPSNVHIVDIRETYEWNEDHIPSAVYLGRGFLEARIVFMFNKRGPLLVILMIQ